MTDASERAAAAALAEVHGHPAVVLSESALDLTALDLIPRAIAEAHGFLPIGADADTITLAVSQLVTSQGGRPPIFDQVEFATGRKVSAFLAVANVVAEAIAAGYEHRARGETDMVAAGRDPSSPPLALVRPAALTPADDALAHPPGRDDDDDDLPAAVGTLIANKPIVLVVDDEADIRTLLRRLLTYDGYDVVEAASGRAAFDLLRTLRPSVILLDGMLPEIHGFEICATLKQSAAFKDTPIVVVSAVYKGWENARAVQETHGADAFVEKPFDIHYLRQLVARLVGKALPPHQLTADWRKKVKALRDEAETAYQLDDASGCEDAVKRWRALDPFDAHAWALLGNARTKQGDLEGAMKAWERAATFDGELFAAFKNLGIVYDQLGFQQRALMAWSRAHELAPNDEARAKIEQRLAGHLHPHGGRERQ